MITTILNAIFPDWTIIRKDQITVFNPYLSHKVKAIITLEENCNKKQRAFIYTDNGVKHRLNNPMFYDIVLQEKDSGFYIQKYCKTSYNGTY